MYCRQRKLREFVEGKGEENVKDCLIPAKTQYLVIDNGGTNLRFKHRIISPRYGEREGGGEETQSASILTF